VVDETDPHRAQWRRVSHLICGLNRSTGEDARMIHLVDVVSKLAVGCGPRVFIMTCSPADATARFRRLGAGGISQRFLYMRDHGHRGFFWFFGWVLLVNLRERRLCGCQAKKLTPTGI